MVVVGFNEKARALITAEAIIAGFLFVSTTIQIPALHEMASEGYFPASTFVVTVANYAFLITALRSIWLAFKALDGWKDELYKVAYRMFVATILGVIMFNIVPAVLSVSKLAILNDPAPISFGCLEDPIKWGFIALFVPYAFMIILNPERLVTFVYKRLKDP